MKKIAPTTRAINAVSAFQKSTNNSGLNHQNNNKRKVQFDTATVSFQVDYDLPDDDHLKKKVPVWAEHWEGAAVRPSTLASMLKKVTTVQWIKLLIGVTCLILLIFNITTTTLNFIHFDTVVTAKYQLPNQFVLPAVTICLPVIVPFEDKNFTTVGDLFNSSLSEYGHRCVFSAGDGQRQVNQLAGPVLPCATLSLPELTIDRDRKCYTYFYYSSPAVGIRSAPTSFIAINLQTEKVPIPVTFEQPQSPVAGVTSPGAGSDVWLAVHQTNMVPTRDRFEFVSLRPGQRYDFRFRLVKVQLSSGRYMHHCRNYSSSLVKSPFGGQPPPGQSHDECTDQCIQKYLKSQCGMKPPDCVSRYAPIRKSLHESRQRLCPLSRCTAGNYEKARDACLSEETQCPADCERDNFELSTKETPTGDPTSAVVVIRRQLAPDLVIGHLPAMTYVQFLATVGGLVAFWCLVAWLLIGAMKLGLYCWELIELYYL